MNGSEKRMNATKSILALGASGVAVLGIRVEVHVRKDVVNVIVMVPLGGEIGRLVLGGSRRWGELLNYTAARRSNVFSLS